MGQERIIGELVADMRTVKETVKDFDGKLDTLIAKEHQRKGASRAFVLMVGGCSGLISSIGTLAALWAALAPKPVKDLAWLAVEQVWRWA